MNRVGAKNEKTRYFALHPHVNPWLFQLYGVK